MHAKLLQSCLTLCDPMDCSPPGSSVLGISQARILDWVAIYCSRGSSWPRGWTRISCGSSVLFKKKKKYASRFTLCAVSFWVLTNVEYHVPITKLLHRIVLFSQFHFLRFFQQLFLILPNTDMFTISIAMLFAIFYVNSILPFQTGFFHLTIYI